MARKYNFSEFFDSYETPLNNKNDIPTKNVNIEKLDEEVFRRVCRELDDEYKDNLVNYGGYYIREYQENYLGRGTTEAINSSFSQYEDVEVSLIVEWKTDEGKRRLPLQFTMRDYYNHYSGGWS